MIRNMYLPGSEDCLFLNVYTPFMNPRTLLPVMVYIHGGGFVYGSGNDDFCGPDFLIDMSKEKKKGVVVVTINYRLGELGFLCLNTAEVPGNAGMKDQVAALRWVQINIRNFGGDPNNVTIFGESAGGMSCTLHSTSPMSRGLFHRIIAMSGVARVHTFEFEQQRKAFVLAKGLGFETTNATALLEFLQSVPSERLIQANTNVIAAEQYMGVKLLNMPVVEKDCGQKRFLEETHDISIKKGLSEVSVMAGYTSKEGIFLIPNLENFPILENYGRYIEGLTPRDIYYQSTPKIHLKVADLITEYYTGSNLPLKTIPQFVQYGSDIFIYPIVRYADVLSKFSKSSIYFYEFSSMSERNIFRTLGKKYGIPGVAHTDDLMYVFHAKYYNLPVNKNATSYKMIRQMCALFTNFAINGNPTPDASLGAIWPRYNANTRLYINIGKDLTNYKNPGQPIMDFYESIYKVANLQKQF
ncbi:juvenile hormone esterase-like isoform X2 [Bicyclus anynana]|nr:juvenile hormone esterase-like isoform X2 [Bicyclus anynana]